MTPRLLLCIASFALATAAAAPVAERPEVKPGDRWTFAVWQTEPSIQSRRIWVVSAVHDASIEGTENGEPLKLTRELNMLESPRGRHSNPNGLRFPLEVGRSWRYSNEWYFAGTGGKGTADSFVEVVAFEKVNVPAGEFEAFRLVGRDKVGGRSPKGSIYDAEIVTTYWYAPQARAIVKLESHNPYIGPTNVELVEHIPAK